jgi:hypothetical protein
MSSQAPQNHDREDELSPVTARSLSIDGDEHDSETAKLLNGDAARELEDLDYLEKGEIAAPAPAPQNHEDTVPTRTKLIALAGYFLCNIGLTMYNKAILGSVCDSLF